MSKAPFSILILAVLMGLGAVVQLLLGIMLVLLGATLAITSFDLFGILLIIQSVLGLWVASGLYNGNKYAWFGAIFVTVVGIVNNILTWGHNSKELTTISLIVNIFVLIVLLWNRDYFFVSVAPSTHTASVSELNEFRYFRRV